MPEPNLPPLLLCDDNDTPEIKAERINIDELQRKIPELPAQTRLKLMSEYNLPLKTTITLVNIKHCYTVCFVYNDLHYIMFLLG